jgi:hypothetical protein
VPGTGQRFSNDAMRHRTQAIVRVLEGSDDMLQVICQWLLLIQLIAGFFVMVYQDFNGRKAKPPEGFSGFIGSIIGQTLICAVTYFAGALSAIPGW